MNLGAQRDSIDKLHRDEVSALTLTNFIDVRNVRMIERGGRLRLLSKTAHPVLIRSKLGGKNLQGDFAIEFSVLRQINLAHPARANFRADFVATEFCA